MPTTPYAKLLVSIDGGAPQSGGIDAVTPGASCQLSYESTVGWKSSPPPYVEIYAYPEGWSPGAGWQTEDVEQPNGDVYTAFRYYGKTPPPAFTLPDADHWDKILFALVVNDGVKGGAPSADVRDESTGISIESTTGLRGIAYREGRQFGGNLKWLRDLRYNLGLIAAGVAGGGAPIGAAYVLTGTTVPAELSDAVAAGALAAPLEFASSAGQPVKFTRTSTSTNSVDDVGTTTASSSNATAAGFGPGWLYRAKQGAGSVADVGRLAFPWTDVSTAASKAVLEARTGGGALASVAEFSGTEVKLVALAGVGTRFVQVGADGTLSSTASAGAPTDAAYLTVGAHAGLSNERNISAITSTINFLSLVTAPLQASREAAGTSLADVLQIGRLRSDGGGIGEAGVGAAIAFYGPDGENSGDVIYGRIGVSIVDPTPAMYSGRLRFQAAVAGSDTALGWWDGDGLHIATDLIVAGTTTTVDSTSVDLADRLVVFNSSDLAVVPVPVNIAGFVIDRGSADGVTKRDAPGVFWDEANTRFAVAYNTALDQSTIGTYVTLKTGGLLAPSLDNPSGALALGATATSVSVTPDTTVSGILTKTGTGLTTTVVAGIRAQNSTAATAGVTVQNGYAVVSEGSGWETGGGGSAKTVRAGFIAQPISGGSIGLRLRLVTDPGTGTLGAVTTEYTTSLPGIGGPGWQSPTFNSLADSGNGYRLITSGGTEYGAYKVSSDTVVVEAKQNTSTASMDLWSNMTTGSSNARVRSWAVAGTPTAGYIHGFGHGSGGTYTQDAGVMYDGVYDGPRLRKTALKTGAYTAAAWDLVLCDPSSGGFTVEIPTGTTALTGRRIGVKNYGTSTNTITIQAATGSIQGGTLSISTAWGYYELECLGMDGWIVVAEG